MKSSDLNRFALRSLAAAAMLAGCGASQPPIGAVGAMPQTTARATHADLSVGNDDWNHGNGDVAIFAQGKKSPIRTISAGMRAPWLGIR